MQSTYREVIKSTSYPIKVKEKAVSYVFIKLKQMKTKFIVVLVGAIVLFASFQKMESKETATIEKGMVKIAIMYPSGEGNTFDMDYYASKHMPMVADLFGEPLKKYTIDKGVAGRTPDEPIPYVAIGFFYFNTLADYQEAFGPNA